jgi:hypothetical protein
MAEATTSWPTKRGTVITLADGTRTFVVIHGEIDPKITRASHALVPARDSNGDYLPTVRKGSQESYSELDLSGVQVFHAGDHPTEAAIVDIAFGTGWFAGNWTNTETGSELQNMTLTVRLPQNVAGTTYSTWTLTDAFVKPGAGLTVKAGMVTLDSFVIASASQWTVADTP